MYGEAHLAGLQLDAQLRHQRQEVRVIPVVADDEAGIHGHRLVLVLDVMRVCVAADMARGLEHRDVMLAAEVVGGHVARDPAADDRDLHEHSSSALRGGAFALSGHCCGTIASFVMS